MVEIKEAYANASKSYDRERDNLYFQIIELIERKAIEENYKIIFDSNVLDVGCGTGRFIDSLKNNGAMFFGIDITSEMVALSKKKFKEFDNITILQGNAESLPLPDNYFNLVYSFKALPHVPHLLIALSEMTRVTKPDGIVIFEFYNSRSFRRIFQRFHFYTKWHTPKEIHQILQSFPNLSIIRTYGARTFIPIAFVCKIRVISNIIKKLELKFANSWLNRFSGYYIVVCEKINREMV